MAYTKYVIHCPAKRDSINVSFYCSLIHSTSIYWCSQCARYTLNSWDVVIYVTGNVLPCSAHMFLPSEKRQIHVL